VPLEEPASDGEDGEAPAAAPASQEELR
jgi:hypothetical protein